jgi:hypothetical protein
MVDLAPYCIPFNAFLANSIREFAAERPDVEVSCVGFYGCPQIWEGVLNFWGQVSFDTEKHSTEHLAKYQHRGPGWYAEDEFGRYCNNPADFAFPDYRCFNFEGLCSPGEVFQSVTGELFELDRDEEGDYLDYDLCRVMWECLFRDVLKNFQDFGQLRRAPIFRMGCRLYEGDLREFWRC